ncbi:MAG TPA: alanine racemase [Candidatus Cybelea sp.]|jgi:alanine racemase|nr:alanine racemase [Candidatus Cybelea sp.]
MIGRIAVSLGAIRHNAELLGRLVAPAGAAFVVKGNAYGHGLLSVAAAVESSAARLCVYTAAEGLALRAGGIAAPILVMGPMPKDSLGEAVAAGLEAALWDTRGFATRLAEAAKKQHRRAAVHLKVNTDLNRLGVDAGEVRDAIEGLDGIPDVELAGLFSHLAAAEEIDSPYTARQLEAFGQALADTKPLLEARRLTPIRHIAASAAGMLWPWTRLDMVRFGIALYGLMPSPQIAEALEAQPPDLRPALTYSSELVLIRTVAAGASVGYGGTFHAPREMRIGVLPAGYADGIPRALSNRGAFVVDGALCPIAGRVAMNMTQIDLTDAPRAHVGSTVTLIGRDGDASVSADDWARWAETINYEIVTRLPSELPRVYVDERIA